MKKTLEKLLAIYHIIRGGQYAVYVISNKFAKTCEGRCCCVISDSAEYMFLETVIEATDEYRRTNNIKA